MCNVDIVGKDTDLRRRVTAVDSTEDLSHFTIAECHPFTVHVALHVTTS